MKFDLHARLDALGRKLGKAQHELKTQSTWNDGHKLASGGLHARHAYLKSELDGENADLEAHGQRVTALEASGRHGSTV